MRTSYVRIQEYVDISWMRTYDVLMLVVFLFYLGVLAFGGRIPVILHSFVVIGSFSYLFYKALFYESPYPEDFFVKTSNEKEHLRLEEPFGGKNVDNGDEQDNLSDKSFDRKISNYTDILRKWLQEEKPYLYTDFKLTDVSRVIPLNRSYLSRVFNEGFGHNFSEVVRIYRVNYSKEILLRNPSMPLSKVAEYCGFHSDSTFLRSFKSVTGMTPNQYRMQKVIEH